MFDTPQPSTPPDPAPRRSDSELPNRPWWRQQSLWTGCGYLLMLVATLALFFSALVTAGSWASGWLYVGITIFVSLIILTMASALQLRNDGRLSEKSFLEVWSSIVWAWSSDGPGWSAHGDPLPLITWAATFTRPGKPVDSIIHVKSTPGVDEQQRRVRRTLTPAEDATHAVYQVYYGTDRTWQQPAADVGTLGISVPAFVLIAFGMFLLGGAVTIFWLTKEFSWTATGLAIASIGLLTVTVLRALFPLKFNRAAARSFGSGRGELHYGICTVSIPRKHQSGLLESPSLLRFEFREDPALHVVLQRVDVLYYRDFIDDFRRAAEVAPTPREALVFVHGYNVTFEDAARRTAQLAHDLGYQGVPAFYSWPSTGRTLPYTWDEDSVGWTVSHLKTFLERLIRDGGLTRVHLLAHSMGNRCLMDAVLKLNTSTLDGNVFDQLVLAAPDIDADTFRKDIAPGLVGRVGRLTLYASSRDKALLASKEVHGYARAGDAGPGIVVVQGMDSVDASLLETDYLGHSYFGDSTYLVTDLQQIIKYGLPPEKRRWMYLKQVGATRKYWEFKPSESPEAVVDSR